MTNKCINPADIICWQWLFKLKWQIVQIYIVSSMFQALFKPERKNIEDTLCVSSAAALQWSSWIWLSGFLGEDRGTGGNLLFQKTHNSNLWNWEGNITLPEFLVIDHCTADVNLNLPAQGYLHISPGFPAQSCLVSKTLWSASKGETCTLASIKISSLLPHMS